MAFAFKAVIYKVGINPVVEVPERITSKMKATKGYIPVKGMINGFEFQQTLCPVKNAPYRLYVNGGMMKGGEVKVGDEAGFKLEQDEKPPLQEIKMPVALAKRLKEEGLMEDFIKIIPSRKKEVFRYLHLLKTQESLQRNIEKIIINLKKNGKGTPWTYGP